MQLTVYEFYLLLHHYMKINTCALVPEVTEGRPGSCGERTKLQWPSMFYSLTVCLGLHWPTFPSPSTGTFSWKAESGGEVGNPEKTILSTWGWLFKVSPRRTASASVWMGTFPLHPKEPWAATRGICQLQGVFPSLHLSCLVSGGWKLWMFMDQAPQNCFDRLQTSLLSSR